MTAPSGEQIGIAAADQQAVVVEVGGGLRSYLVAGAICSTATRPPSSAGRVADRCCCRGRTGCRAARYEFGGARHQVPLDEPESNNAIHGLVRWANWRSASARRTGS